MDLYRYNAFGFQIESEYNILQLTETNSTTPADVFIKKTVFDSFDVENGFTQIQDDEILVSAENVAKYRITGGNLIEVEKALNCKDAQFSLYLLGSCIGAIIHQKGLFPLHGSCVTNGKKSILITGDSGAGKSTTAAEFLKNGWKLVTDDVTLLTSINPPMVQSSYPSQKLWGDSLQHYQKNEEVIHSLYNRNDEEKYGIDVSDFFFDGTAPLSLIVRLAAEAMPTQISPINGMAKVNQLLYNTYRLNMIPQKALNQHFQKCVTLSSKIPMALMIRNNKEQCVTEVYEKIIGFLK